MNHFKAREHLSAKRVIGILLLICSCLMTVGCSQKGTAEENANASIDKNEEAIRAVIEKEFNGLDKKYRELWDAWGAAMETETEDMSQEEYDAMLEKPEYKNLIGYAEDSYAPYFTGNGYDLFSRTNAFMYSFSDKEYKLNPSDIEITQSENGETLYGFAFTVAYENENGETSDFSFDGKAIVPQEGKIGKIEFNDKDGLLQKINE